MEEERIELLWGFLFGKPDSWRSDGCKFSVTYGQRMRRLLKMKMFVPLHLGIGC